MLLTVPFVITAGALIAGLLVGSGWGLLPLLVVGPAIAASLGGARYTVAVGAAAVVAGMLFDIDTMHEHINHRAVVVAVVATAGITVVGMLAAARRERRTQELAQLRLVADVAQQVVLRPVPPRVGAVRLAVRYLSASSQARVGGDLYEVAVTPAGVRLIVGDAEGKGLPAVQSAALVTGVFREAAHEECDLAAIVARIEASLARELGDEQFVTAVLAEISPDQSKMQLITCGHPAPLLLGSGTPRYAGSAEGSLPLGLSHLAGPGRISVTVPFEAGEQVLFYTDGASEARDKAGRFFPLAGCSAISGPPDPATLVDRLSQEVVSYVGHAPDDDIALLLAYKQE
jgi:serine phosphatase RsbU (regulator of sigma subunit)